MKFSVIANCQGKIVKDYGFPEAEDPARRLLFAYGKGVRRYGQEGLFI
jgi:hypothetical protein